MTLTTEKVTMKAGSIHRFSLETYNQMIDAGILTKYDRVELIRGEIVNKEQVSDRHTFAYMDYQHRLAAYRDEATIMSRCPVQMLTDSEPEPDLSFIKSPLERYRERKPRAEDTLLIIELSDLALTYDRGTKLNLYAEAGIPEVWLRNLQDDVLEVYREPMQGRYGFHQTLLSGEEATPLFSQTPFKWSRD